MALDLGIIFLTVIVGPLLVALVWLLTRKSAPAETTDVGANEIKKKEPKKSKESLKKNKAASAPVKDSKAAFTHSWLLTSLKGHTGPITDMDFSANGKHLATCAEELDEVVETPTSGCVLSRRQKKNRQKREAKKKETTRRATLLKYYVRLQMKNSELYSFLSEYVLLDDQLLNLGYPVESAFYPDRAIIYKTPDANYHRSDSFTIEMAAEHLKPPLSPSLEKRCVRCQKGFFVTLDGEYLTEERCVYHWGSFKYGYYTCCQGDSPCATGQLHVWNGVSPGMNGPFTHYVRTIPASSNGIYALDCEMCYTGRGLEVCKVSVISIDGCLVYETLVKPMRKVVDYNTRFSGLSEHDLKMASKTVFDVQRDLLAFIFSNTILIGHGLENDLRALGILHTKIIDTAVLFPHYYGFPFRRSLKSLVAAYLQRSIQNGCHDSFEDARACAELVLCKAAHTSAFYHEQ